MNDPIQTLRDEFRRHLEVFYAQLRLAPPYHSLEKAVALFVTKIKSMPTDQQESLLRDRNLRWVQYSQAFIESGLNMKHRGIIAGLRQKPLPSTFPPEYENFLKTFSD